jgi:putative membrane protein (TIGR04086 family)
MKKLAKDTGMSLLCSFLITVLVLLAVAFVALKAGLGEAAVSKIMVAVYVLAPAAGGFMLGKKRKVNRFLWGLCVGVLYFAVYAVIALTTKDVSFGNIAWVLLPMCFGGMAGGMLS